MPKFKEIEDNRVDGELNRLHPSPILPPESITIVNAARRPSSQRFAENPSPPSVRGLPTGSENNATTRQRKGGGQRNSNQDVGGHLTRSLSRTRGVVVSAQVDFDPAPAVAEPRKHNDHDHRNIEDSRRDAASHIQSGIAAEKKISDGTPERSKAASAAAYRTGETLRDPSHSLSFTSPSQASFFLSRLPVNCRLFLKRGSKEWVCAKLMGRVTGEDGEMSVMVSLDDGGTKMRVLESGKWMGCLRLANLNPTDASSQFSCASVSSIEDDSVLLDHGRDTSSFDESHAMPEFKETKNKDVADELTRGHSSHIPPESIAIVNLAKRPHPPSSSTSGTFSYQRFTKSVSVSPSRGLPAAFEKIAAPKQQEARRRSDFNRAGGGRPTQGIRSNVAVKRKVSERVPGQAAAAAVAAYRAGQTLHDPSHSLRFTSLSQASVFLSRLPMNCRLFLKRGPQEWVCVKLIGRVRDMDGEMSVIVSLDEEGMMRKVLRRREWMGCLRLANLNATDAAHRSSCPANFSDAGIATIKDAAAANPAAPPTHWASAQERRPPPVKNVSFRYSMTAAAGNTTAKPWMYPPAG